MISFHEAKSKVLQEKIKLKSEIINVEESLNRVIYKDVVAPFSLPLFDNSAMDGFAVNYNDLILARDNKPIHLSCIGESTAGNPFNGIINIGECIKCMTGAMIPNGANAVIKVEDTDGFNKSIVSFYKKINKHQNIRFIGEEIQKGEIIIPKNKKITPNSMGVLTSIGADYIRVYEKIKIALITTGDEVRPTGSILKSGEIYNSNKTSLEALVDDFFGKIIYHEHIFDNKNKLMSQISQLSSKYDILITTGGISMGEADHLKSVFESLGIKKKFWKVAQKPGKPLFFGTKNNSLVFGLPGNPVSANICFYLYILPAIKKALGITNSIEFKGTLDDILNTETNKYRFLFGKYWIDINGNVKCRASKKVGSHMLTSSVDSNCILLTPPRSSLLEKGELIDIIPLRSNS